MKKLLLILFCFESLVVFAQPAVGIGTTSPNSSAMLDVTSTNKGVLFPRLTTAQRNAIGTPAKGLMVYDSTNAAFYFYNAGWHEISESNHDWLLSGSNVYYNAGNVGIGTSAPTERLSITSGKIFLRDNRTDQNPHLIFDIPAVDFKEGGLQWKRSGDTLGALNYIANPNTPNYVRLSMQQKGYSPDLVVNTNGNTGLGIVNPLVKLHIYNFSGVEMLRLEGQAPLIQLKRRTTADNVINPLYKDIGFLQTSGDDIRIGTNSDNDLGKFVVRTNGADRMYIDQSGNVSIGTPDVAAGYRVSVLGKIICEELKVQVKASWPDYVFQNNYGLMPLQDLRNYIKQHQHLPNIPAAKDVHANGMEMGDMQRRMMEKIEELTLYVLELQQQVDQLKKAK